VEFLSSDGSSGTVKVLAANTQGTFPLKAIRPVAVKLDKDTRDRIQRLAEARDRSAHWMMREAIAQCRA
jgi:hypothetical protein